MKNIYFIATMLASSIGIYACNGSNSNNSEPQLSIETNNKVEDHKKTVPEFNEQNAYNFIQTQVDFGPRVPNTPAQEKCAAWLQQQLNEYCDTVYRQETTLLAGDQKTKLKCINLIGSINPAATRRILLLAHWDTRPWADRDNNKANEPILGADDGGSGVAVILELARIINAQPLHNSNIGIDILFADVEDYGKSEWGSESYALGTQYWARNPHIPGYKAEAGILFDMVGGKNAVFSFEGFSREYANRILRDVWNAAKDAGFSSYFVHQNGPYIEDDHVPVNKITGIPTIDIINLPPNSQTGFVHHWHTHDDNMDAIDKATLKAVGQTVLQYLYNY